MLSDSKKDYKTGVVILRSCMDHEECHTEASGMIDMVIARVLFSLENLRGHRQCVVDDCLMHLPPRMLSVVSYGEGNSEESEVAIRCKYISLNSKELSDKAKQAIIRSCDAARITSSELQKIRCLGILTENDLPDLYHRAMSLLEQRVFSSKAENAAAAAAAADAVSMRREFPGHH